MSDRIERLKDIFKAALPDKGSPEFAALKSSYERQLKEEPGLEKEMKKRFKKASGSLQVQNLNGIDLGVDRELRYYLREFNHRSWQYGLSKMPLMFNVMEAFFHYQGELNYFQLLEEEDYLLSLFDFIDFFTSPNFKEDTNKIYSNIDDDLIYNFHIGADLDKITFKTENRASFVVSGASLVKRSNEVTIFLLTGKITNTEEVSKTLTFDTQGMMPGKENIEPSNDYNVEAVKLNDNANYWKTLMACRFDLESQTIDARYVASDIGEGYNLITDEIGGFLNNNGEFLKPELEKLYKKSLSDIENFVSLFELAKAILYVPYYFNHFDGEISCEEHITEYKNKVTKPTLKKKFRHIDNKLKIRSRPLWILNRDNKFSSDRIILRDDKFMVETTGYWKKLRPDEFGTDKKGRKVTGKTWVNRKDSYLRAKTDDLIVSDNTTEEFTNEEAGYIYVMRNPIMPENTFKIGLTQKTTNQRAKQLSNTSVPDKFHIMREWSTKDCYKAEKEIHSRLKGYRVDDRREFFTVEMQIINDTIEEVISEINKI